MQAMLHLSPFASSLAGKPTMKHLHFLGRTRLSSALARAYSVKHSRAPSDLLQNSARPRPYNRQGDQYSKGIASTATPSSSEHVKAEGTPPFFETVMPWYFGNWVWLIVGLDVAWVVFEVDSMLNHFVDKVPQADGTMKLELKPLWQRAGAAALVAMGGLTFAAGMLLTRSRNVRLIQLQKGGKRIYVETASNRPGQGRFINREDCVISPNRGDDFVDMVVNGSRGRYPLRLKGATVDGIAGDPLDVRKRLFDRWYRPTPHRAR